MVLKIKFNYTLCNVIKSRLSIEETAFNKNSPGFGFQLKEETSQVLHLEHNFYIAETWRVWKVDQKYLKSF